jgi:hypothetical protein
MKVDAAVTRQRIKLTKLILYAATQYPIVKATVSLTMAANIDFARENVSTSLKRLLRNSVNVTIAVKPLWRLEGVSPPMK